MSVTGWAAAFVAIAFGVSGSVPEVEPSAAAQSAMAVIAAPTVATALPGSTRLDEDVYRVEGDCAAAIERYLAADAPVPAGSTRKKVGQSVVVELPYARSGVFFESGDGYCQYQIVNAPTMRLKGTVGAVPSGDGYSSVLCSEESDTTELIVMTDLPVDGADAVLVIMARGAAVVPGSMGDIFGRGQEPELSLDVSVVSPGPDQFEFEITDAGATTRVTGSCTGSVYQYLGGL